MRAVAAVSILLLALSETVHAFGGGVPFALDADGCVVDYQAGVDYYPPERRAMMEAAGTSHPTATKAEDFSISYHKTYKVVRNLPTGLSYILRHCGTPEELSDLPADAAGSPVFVVPVKKWSSGLTTTYTFLEELDLISHAVVVDDTYMSSACGQKLVACGVIADPPTSPAAGWTAAVAASGSEVHFTDKPSFGTQKTGLRIDVAFDASHDPGLLNRAEWLKFAATFFNKEPEANRFFEDVRSRFDVIVDMVTAKRLAGAASPRVAFLSAPGAYSGVYNDCPFGGYEIKVLQGYKEHLVSYGGGTSFDPAVAARWCSLTEGCSSYICPNATSMKKVLRTIDVVIDETSSATPASYTIDTFKAGFELTDSALNDAGETSADYPFLASSRVYRVDKRLSPANGGTDWMESALPHADMTLLDFAVSLVPELKDETFNHPVRGSIDLADFETRWLRNIAAGEVAAVVDPSECDDPSAVCPGDPAALSATAPVYNGCNSDFCFTAFPPLPPYSKPSPPPPMQPLGTSLVAIVAEVFEISVTAAGTVDTLDKAGYETKMRTYLGCRAPLCQVAIAVTAGSVNVVATVTDTTFMAVTAAKKLRTDSITALSTALGVTVKATPTVSAATKTTLTVFFAAPPPPTVNTESDAGVVGGVVGGLLGAATLGLFGCVCYRYSREKQGNPVFHNMDGARAVGATVTAVGATLTSPASDTGINMEPVSHLESTGTL